MALLSLSIYPPDLQYGTEYFYFILGFWFRMKKGFPPNS